MSKRICRLCLGHPSVCFSLLENNLPEMLEALTSIKVNANDVLSTISCMKCLLNMKLAFNIQQNILRADEKFKELTLLNNVEVKLEVPDLVLDQDLLKHETFPEASEPEEMLKLCCSKCVICGTEAEGHLLVKHVQDHFTEAQFCDCCNKSFGNIKEYKDHFAQHHSQFKNTSHQCATCGITFRYKSLFNIHDERAHRKKMAKKSMKLLKENESYTCGECQKEFTCKRQFTNHTHARRECPICRAQITKSNLKKHILNHSSGPQVCELCGATLRSLESLRGHISHTHSSLVYNCDECGKVFKKRYAFLLHKKKHSGEKSHICETCGKGFLTFYYLNKHIKMAHLKLRPFTCEFCEKSFCSKFALRTHRRQHTNETPYKCEMCGEGFRQNVSLKAHRKSKHNVVEAKTCACPVCGKLFASEQAIIGHMRLH